jgi:hypothetical protein
VKFTVALLFIIGFFSCESFKDYSNKPRYTVSVGDEIPIYYSTNSCCHYCLLKEEDLKHIELEERLGLDNGLKDCAGCDYQAVYLFKAKSIGIDTVKLVSASVNEICDSTTNGVESYIIEVK